MLKTENKIVIIGAGPAGLTCSLFLSQKGIPNIIIEKEQFPRNVICGDALSPKVVRILSDLKGQVLHELIARKSIYNKIKGIIFVSPNGKKASVQLNESGESPVGLTLKRVHFDNFLFEKVNETDAEILQNTYVTKVVRKNGAIIVEAEHKGDQFEIPADLVIGADGHNSIVYRDLCKSTADVSEFALGVRTYFNNIEDINEDFLELYYYKQFLPGYLWIFPMPDGSANVGITMMKKDILKKKINLGNELKNIISSDIILKNRFKSAIQKDPLAAKALPLGLKRRKVNGDNYLLIGDSAGLIDPFTQEGVGNAMLSGKLAAEVIEDAKKENNFSAKVTSQYEKKIKVYLENEFRVNKRLHKLGRNPYYYNMVLKKLEHNRSMKNLLASIITNSADRSSILKRSLYSHIFK